MNDVADEPDGWGKPHRGRSRAEHEAVLAAKLTPSALKFTLAFAGLFQLTHELLKSSIWNKCASTTGAASTRVATSPTRRATVAT